MNPTDTDKSRRAEAIGRGSGQDGVIRPVNWQRSVPASVGSASPASQPPLESLNLLEARAPRYTSYPTADRFVTAFGPEEHARHLSSRHLQPATPLSVYVHIPFCRSLCYYCACNKSITQDYRKAQRYLAHLRDELGMISERLTGERRLQQLHLGGGTPTFLNSDDLRLLVESLAECFTFTSTGEYAIEIDPRTVDRQKLAVLRDCGFNRLSLGIQDFDEQVQHAINRVQSLSMVTEVLQEARRLGFESTNFDLIYGLPKQTLRGIERTMDKVIALRPERVALYNYAHLPSRFKAQRLIREADMPDAALKQAIFGLCQERLDAAGYNCIGMDHFALPEDSLSIACRNGRLQRNFQGYSTQAESDLVALGASAISRIGSSYSQNVRGVNDYCDRIAQKVLPTESGIELNRDDLLRRTVIMAIMCQGEVDKATFEIGFLIDFDDYFAAELEALTRFEQQGFVVIEPERLVITTRGRRDALRLVAGQFDRYLQQQASRSRYSKIL